MVNITTNIPSLVAQRSLNNSTKLLNQAIERMTTGYKINHASDNAANYSISTNMSTKISAYQVAEDNVAMGLDLLSTAGGSLDLISDKLTRLRALAEQAANGTYGELSLKAIKEESKSIKKEINRIYNSAEFNGKKFFKESEAIDGFMNEVEQRDTSSMTKLSSINPTTKLTKGSYSISTAEELAQLATMTNSGNIGANTEFVLSNDIDLEKYCSEHDWTPIGAAWNGDKMFNAKFDGNGHVIENFSMSKQVFPDGNTLFYGLFSGLGATAVVTNLGIENANIDLTSENNPDKNKKQQNVGILAGYSLGATITNSYTTGNVSAGNTTGGFINWVAKGTIEDCYSKANVQSDDHAGGFVRDINGTVKNCGAFSTVHAKSAGGFSEAVSEELEISDCFAYGDVSSKGGEAGGFITNIKGVLNATNCYSTGDVYASETDCAGGFIAYAGNVNLVNCYQTGTLYHQNVLYVGQFIGGSKIVTLKNCSALGISDKLDAVLVAQCNLNGSVSAENCKYNSYYEGNVKKFGTQFASTSKLKKDIENIAINYSTSTNIQCGINSSNSSQIDVNIDLDPILFNPLYNINLTDSRYLDTIDDILMQISSYQTKLGATENRLESALEEISTQYENLTSSRSTLKDADIAEVSSEYIRQQILQQASATLMATANQSPALALQLL